WRRYGMSSRRLRRASASWGRCSFSEANTSRRSHVEPRISAGKGAEAMHAQNTGRAGKPIGRRAFLAGAAGSAAALASGALRAVIRTEGVRAAPSTTLQFWYTRYAVPLL